MDGEPALDLSRPRGLSELLSTTMTVFGRHSGLFFSVTLIVVVPVFLLVDGVWGRALRDGADADPGVWPTIVSTLLTILVVPAFVTALHCVIVRDLGRGIVPSPLAALRESGPRLLSATGAVTLSTLAVTVGLVLLIVPGIWLAVRLYFAAQMAVLDRAGPGESLQYSEVLVEGRWWWTAGALVLALIAFGAPIAIAGQLVRQIDVALVYVVLHLLLQTISLSLSALFGTLLFFALRAEARAAA